MLVPPLSSVSWSQFLENLFLGYILPTGLGFSPWKDHDIFLEIFLYSAQVCLSLFSWAQLRLYTW